MYCTCTRQCTGSVGTVISNQVARMGQSCYKIRTSEMTLLLDPLTTKTLGECQSCYKIRTSEMTLLLDPLTKHSNTMRTTEERYGKNVLATRRQLATAYLRLYQQARQGKSHQVESEQVQQAPRWTIMAQHVPKIIGVVCVLCCVELCCVVYPAVRCKEGVCKAVPFNIN